MGYNDTVFGNFYNAFGNFVKLGCSAKHSVIDTRKINYKGLYFTFRIDETYKLIDNGMAIKLVDGNLGYTLFIVLSTGGLYV